MSDAVFTIAQTSRHRTIDDAGVHEAGDCVDHPRTITVEGKTSW
jgi:hypothetical protein